MRSLLERVLGKISPEPNGGCWLWIGSRDVGGYGRLRVGPVIKPAHRVAYEVFVGCIPPGRCLDHLCRVPACVNPAHLEPVTIAENTRRGRSGWHNAIKTHCPRGHEYAEGNVYYSARGKRECRICRAAHRAAYKQRKREQAHPRPL